MAFLKFLEYLEGLSGTSIYSRYPIRNLLPLQRTIDALFLGVTNTTETGDCGFQKITKCVLRKSWITDSAFIKNLKNLNINFFFDGPNEKIFFIVLERFYQTNDALLDRDLSLQSVLLSRYFDISCCILLISIELLYAKLYTYLVYRNTKNSHF